MPEGVYFGPRDGRRISGTVRAFEAGASGLLTPKKGLFQRDVVPVQFRNDFAGTVPAHGVMRVGTPVTSDGVQVLPANRPDTTFRRLYLVNGPEEVAQNAFGWGTWLWHADWVLYDDASTPADGESWGPQDGSFEIKKWRYGFTIRGNPTGGTTDLVQAQQEWVNQFLCKSNEAITANGDTGAASVYDGNQADITGTDVTVTNRTGLNWDSGKWGVAIWLGGTWFASPWECPA